MKIGDLIIVEHKECQIKKVKSNQVAVTFTELIGLENTGIIEVCPCCGNRKIIAIGSDSYNDFIKEGK